MLNKDEIIQKLNANHIRMADTVKGLNETDFSTAPDGKWTQGQQLDHIYRSLKPLTMAIGLPKFAVRLLIGTANRPSRDYQGMVDKYEATLAGGATATGAYVPKTITYRQADGLAANVKSNLAKLVSNLHKYSEEDLDRLVLPHPLMGKLTVREMLYFTIYHSEHHYRVTLRNLGKTP